MSRLPEEIIVRPLVTEKTSTLQFDENKYTFEVVPDANKPEIRRAVEQLFEVRVRKVRTMNYRGKKRRVGRSQEVSQSKNWKKAVVELAEGDSIDVFEGF